MDSTTIPPRENNPSEPAEARKPLRVLIVDDSENEVMFVLRALRDGGYEPIYQRVCTASTMREALQKQVWQLVISDFHMPDFSGFESLEVMKQSGLDVPFILVSGLIGEETAVAAMKAGAQDYIMKRKLARLVPAIERELREAQIRVARKAAEEALRQSEEQLRQSQKIEAVGRLASGVAHDFNNVLTAIMGYSQLLLKKIENSPPQQRYAEEIQRCADRGASLTRQLLAFSRNQVLEPRVLDLNVLVTDLEPMLRRLIGEDIKLVSQTTNPLGHIKADPGQLEQVIVNLVVNARDAMPHGGTLTIKTDNVNLKDESLPCPAGIESGLCVLISVADTGTGMSDKVKVHLFEPFFTTKPTGKGTGLGLATSYGIIKQNGGHIEFSSELESGTTFRIYLPRVEESLPVLAQVGEQPIRTVENHETLFLVEDETAVRESSELVLSGSGYKVLSAPDAQEALRQRPDAGGLDLLITDIVMPGLGGYELAHRLRSRRPDLKVLFTSGHTQDKLAPFNCLAPGTGFLQKPYRPEVLARKVREMLDAGSPS
jgi:two-component system, cell cycle sensor histidine kinase and response regulator CckA